MFTVELPLPEVATRGEGLLTHGTLQALFVPGRVVDAHEKAVGDGPRASLAHGTVLTVGS